MSDPSFAGVATLGRIRDLHKSKMAATETRSNRKISITLYKITLERWSWAGSMVRYIHIECHKCAEIYFITSVICINLKSPPLKPGQIEKYQ